MPEEVFETPQPTESNSFNWPKVVLAVALGLGLLAAASYAGYWYGIESSKVKDQISNLQLKTQIPETPKATPTPTPTIEDDTRDWKTHTSDTISFKYPTSLVLEERQKNYFVLLSDPENPQSVIVSIDARLTGNYSSYNNAVESTKAGLTDVQTQEIDRGIKISGRVGPGYGEGQQVTIALFKYQESAVAAETTSTETSQLQIFNQILSTFKFLN